MKKTLLTLFIALLTGATAMAQGVATSVEGSYTGDLYVSLYAPATDDMEPIPDQSVNIVADSENTVTLSLRDFSFAGMLLGDIVLEEIPVSMNADNSVVFGDKAPKDFTFHATMEGNYVGDIIATAKVNSENSSINGLKLAADIDVVWDNGGDYVPIYVRFNGERPAPTGIEAATSTSAKTTGVYTLTGVRVAANNTKGLPKGIYLVGGKKVFVK